MADYPLLSGFPMFFLFQPPRHLSELPTSTSNVIYKILIDGSLSLKLEIGDVYS